MNIIKPYLIKTVFVGAIEEYAANSYSGDCDDNNSWSLVIFIRCMHTIKFTMYREYFDHLLNNNWYSLCSNDIKLRELIKCGFGHMNLSNDLDQIYKHLKKSRDMNDIKEFIMYNGFECSK
jgi:hypothetical protein